MMNPKKRPLTQREIRQSKQKKAKTEKVIIINKCKKQTVTIQLKAPKGYDFFVGEQTVPLYPLRKAEFPKNRLYPEQIRNYEKAGRIQVLSKS